MKYDVHNKFWLLADYCSYLAALNFFVACYGGVYVNKCSTIQCHDNNCLLNVSIVVRFSESRKWGE